MKKILYLIFIVNCFSCTNEKNKDKHFSTTEICDKIYVERFIVFGSGALGADLHSKYITDSTNFRLFIGTEDTDKEKLFTECKGDSLIVEKLKIDEKSESLKLFERKIFSKKELIKKGKFE